MGSPEVETAGPDDPDAAPPVATTPGSVRTLAWRDGKRVSEDFPLADISEHIEDECLVWADVCRPDHEQLTRLADELGLHATAIEDATTFHERPKAIRYNSHLFVSTFAVTLGGDLTDPDDYRVSRISAFVLPHAFITVRLDDTLDVDELQARWENDSDLLKYGSKTLLHGLLDMVVDGYFDAIERADDAVEKLADRLFEDNTEPVRSVYQETFQVRRDVSKMRRVILPMREVVNTVMHRVVEFDHDAELVPYYQDLYDHMLRAAEWTDDIRDTLSSIHETNLSIADHRMNEIMKKLTAWAAIIAVPTAITGYYGQNVPYPGFAKEWGYALSLIMIFSIALALYAVFKRRGWL